ncbi:hypothetical protein ACLB2K_034677 [Fragaria x ananassa]
MKLEVQVISKEIIKPSSPTPDNLHRYRLSFLDQITTPNMYSFFILFFEFNGETQPNITGISNHLKKSLADVLTLFYPLAGVRAHDNINCKLSDFLRNPIPDELTKLVPFQLDDSDNQIRFGVQLNVFECGGFAIGQCVSHKIADGLSTLMFSKAWAETTLRALGDHQAEISCPEFVSATLFPPKLVADPETISGLAKKKLVTKRFVFDASNIEQLRAKYEQLERPTRVETLTAFIWSCLVADTTDYGIHDNQKLHKVSQVVNLRRKLDPPLAPHTFGNIITLADSIPSLLNTGEECYGLARQVREAIRKIDKVYIRKLQQGEDDHGSSSEGSITSVFTILCNFPLYDSDFGWGRPLWVSMGMPGLDFNNVVIFTDTRDANGIEASITSTKEVLIGLETDTEFLKRVRPSWVSSGLSLTPKRTTTANMYINTRNRVSSMVKEPRT